MNRSLRYCGRLFSDADIDCIRRLMDDDPGANRARLSRIVCEQLGWRRDDGRLKEMSCRVAMLRMQDDGLIELPPPRNRNGNGKTYRRRTARAEPELFPVVIPAGRLSDLHLEPVARREDSHLWNEYIERYHYLVPSDNYISEGKSS